MGLKVLLLLCFATIIESAAFRTTVLKKLLCLPKGVAFRKKKQKYLSAMHST